MIRLASLALALAPLLVAGQAGSDPGAAERGGTVLSQARQEPTGSPPPSSEGVSWLSLLQTGLAVTAVVVGVRWMLPRLLRPKGTGARMGAELLRVIDTQQAGPAGLHIVEACGRRFLIGVTPSAVELITELEAGEPRSFAEYVESTDLRERVSAAAERLERLISE